MNIFHLLHYGERKQTGDWGCMGLMNTSRVRARRHHPVKRTLTFCKHVEATETHRMLRGRLGLGFAHRQTQVAKPASTCLSDPSLRGIALGLGRRCCHMTTPSAALAPMTFRSDPSHVRLHGHSGVGFAAQHCRMTNLASECQGHRRECFRLKPERQHQVALALGVFISQMLASLHPRE